MKLNSSINSSLIISIILIFLAIGIQIQLTLFQTDSYSGLRINTVDLVLPLLGSLILISLYLKKTSFPKFHVPNALLWLCILGLVFIAALAHSYLLYGEISNWALINKTVGWVILCSYFLLGGWLSQQMTEKHLKSFIKIAAYFLIIITAVQTLDYSLYFLDLKNNIHLLSFPAAGFMANKNSYFFLFLTLLVFITLHYKNIKSPLLLYAFGVLTPFVLIFTGARTSLLILPMLLPYLLFLSSKEIRKKIIISLLIGILGGMIFSYYKTKKPPSFQKQNYNALNIIKNFENNNSNEVDRNLLNRGDSLRIEVLKTSVNMIKDKPFLGSGLGSIIQKETAKDYPRTVMDSTPIWLWAETGVFGLLIFLSFYGVCLKTLYRNSFNKENSETAQNLNKSVFVMLLIFGLMSLFHELLYTRFMWLFMGLSLAYPLKSSVQHQN